MATVPATFSSPGGANDGSVLKCAWTITGTNDGAPFGNPEYADRSVQAVGTWGGGTVVAEGSNDGTNWFGLTNPAGDPVSFAADGGMAIIENVQHVRPRASVAVTSVVVTLLARRGSCMRA